MTGGAYRFLDCLRGIAVLWVMCSHFTGPAVAGSTLRGWFLPFATNGALGVVLFFVISGYCICAAAHRSGACCATFFRARAVRIYPPYWASVVLCAMLAAGISLVGGPGFREVIPLDTWEWIAGLLLMQGPLGAGDIQLVYWSLTIEIKFYLVCGILLAVPGGLRWGVLAVSIATAIWRALPEPAPAGWFITHWGMFSTGWAVWLSTSGTLAGRRMAASLFAVNAASATACAWGPPEPFLVEGALPTSGVEFGALGTGGILAILKRHDSHLCQLLGMATLAWLGRISYSLYLTHYLVGVRVMNIGYRLTHLEGHWWGVFFILALSISILVGMLFHSFAEKPFLRGTCEQKILHEKPNPGGLGCHVRSQLRLDGAAGRRVRSRAVISSTRGRCRKRREHGRNGRYSKCAGCAG